MPAYWTFELVNSSLSASRPHSASPNASRARPKLADGDVTVSRPFVFSLLRAKESERERASERERGRKKKKNGSQQSNKKEEQWRHWIAKRQVWIRSSASPGPPSSVRLNYVLLTVSSHVGSVVVFAGKLSGSAWSNCLWLSWVSSPPPSSSSTTMQGLLSERSEVTVKKYDLSRDIRGCFRGQSCAQACERS